MKTTQLTEIDLLINHYKMEMTRWRDGASPELYAVAVDRLLYWSEQKIEALTAAFKVRRTAR